MGKKRGALFTTNEYILSEDDEDDDYDDYKDREQSRSPKKKRSKLMMTTDGDNDDISFSMQSLLDAVSSESVNAGVGGPSQKRSRSTVGVDMPVDDDGDGAQDDFESCLRLDLEEMKATREKWREESSESAMQGGRHRPLGPMELSHIAQTLRSESMIHELSPFERLLMKRIELGKLRRVTSLPTPTLSFTPPSSSPSSTHHTSPLTPLPPIPQHPLPPPTVISALSSLGTTPYSSCLLARITGPLHSDPEDIGYLMRDWRGAKRAVWKEVMEDIRAWYGLMYPEREQEEHYPAPVDYVTLQPQHVDQIHELLERVFWPGIDITEALSISATKCTVVALYRRLVVGAAFLSSPEETYITYLVVRPGWESAGIATKMLYILLTRNPTSDITLHVSANNPAMLLYNRFGFKAEEFIVGFYEQYLDRNSRQSKNAFRLRLRR